jgi:hypothetical protein
MSGEDSFERAFADGLSGTGDDSPYPAFLGRGWAFPPSFDKVTNSVAMASGERDIRESLWILLSTSLGERIMLATYGCDLISKVFVGLTTTVANEIAGMVTRAITEWEPRVTIEEVTVSQAELSGWVEIDITYCVRRTNSRSNLVFPFYRLEATLPPPRS